MLSIAEQVCFNKKLMILILFFYCILKQFEKDGFAVVENFLNEDEVKNLRGACHKLVEDMNPDEHRTVFSTLKIVINIKSTFINYFNYLSVLRLMGMITF